MKKIFSFTLWGLTVFFAIMFLFIYVLFALTKHDEVENNSLSSEQVSDEENKNNGEDEESSDDDQEKSDSNGDESNNNDSNEKENNQEENKEENAEEDNNENENDENDETNNNDKDTQELYWGVDSANYTDENMYSCVVDNFGNPDVWGRYIGENEGVSTGIDKQEIEFLHENNISILLIYNHVNDVTGSEQGKNHAEKAISMAEELGVPEGIALFLDVEPDYPVDSAFLEAWYEVIENANYQSGIYGVFDESSSLLEAYNAMEQETQENTIVWTAYPQEQITTKDNAPEFNPQGPENSMLYGWQYGLEAESCTIDTNLFQGDIREYLWQE
ncbi:glycoside hydrolase domain-containing protein [Oceanobacillus sp. Castelsardo]|uniref:glycoside hydrolase domain-containing protein n=1 Tax=Oceanobacillus sp. Castelsardo TaxID=1851204 RepID=UPI00083943D3|nr:glycoside hydrolase domain-containing protein [Oceanobacillus sp. Castelsardo]